MTMRFHLLGAGVLAPGLDSIGALVDMAGRSSGPVGRRGPGHGPVGILGSGRSRGGNRSWTSTPRSHEPAAIGAGEPPPEALRLPPVLALPPNERRRASAVARLVLACAEQALAQRPELACGVRLVFAADEGVGDVCQMMLEALADEQPVSPLVFANSVHNAPSGYFSIAHRNHRPATSLCLGEQSFACGLMSAVAEARVTGQPVLFVNYDSPMPMPLHSLLPISQPSATAWLIVACVDAGPCDPRAADDSRPNATAVEPPAATSDAARSTTSLDRPLATFAAELVELQVRDGCDPFDVAPLRLPLDHRPPWLHDSWASNSSALGIAALGLVGADHGVRDFSLGRQALRLSRLADATS